MSLFIASFLLHITTILQTLPITMMTVTPGDLLNNADPGGDTNNNITNNNATTQTNAAGQTTTASTNHNPLSPLNPNDIQVFLDMAAAQQQAAPQGHSPLVLLKVPASYSKLPEILMDTIKPTYNGTVPSFLTNINPFVIFGPLPHTSMALTSLTTLLILTLTTTFQNDGHWPSKCKFMNQIHSLCCTTSLSSSY